MKGLNDFERLFEEMNICKRRLGIAEETEAAWKTAGERSVARKAQSKFLSVPNNKNDLLKQQAILVKNTLHVFLRDSIFSVIDLRRENTLFCHLLHSTIQLSIF